MIIGRNHRPWFLLALVVAIFAAVSRFALVQFDPSYRSAASVPGLIYGTLSALLVLSLVSLSLPRKLPSVAWLGNRSKWLTAHPWLAVLASVTAFCHAGFSVSGIVETTLVIVFSLTFLSGCVGSIIQKLLPRMLTMRVNQDLPHDRLPEICRALRQQADITIESIWPAAVDDSRQSMLGSHMGWGARQQLHVFFESQLRPFLSLHPPKGAWLKDPLQSQGAFDRLRSLPGLAAVTQQLSELEHLADDRRALLTQESLYLWLHGWSVIHVPLALSTALLTVFHAIVALYYRA